MFKSVQIEIIYPHKLIKKLVFFKMKWRIEFRNCAIKCYEKNIYLNPRENLTEIDENVTIQKCLGNSYLNKAKRKESKKIEKKKKVRTQYTDWARD